MQNDVDASMKEYISLLSLFQMSTFYKFDCIYNNYPSASNFPQDKKGPMTLKESVKFVIIIYKFMKLYQYEFSLILIKRHHSMSKVIQIIICFSALFADNFRDL